MPSAEKASDFTAAPDGGRVASGSASRPPIAATTTPADMKIQSEFIGEFVKFVQDAKTAGKTVDDVVKTWATPAKYAATYAKPNPDRVRADAQVIWDETR